ncbi:UNVERIFIED_CONTAM: hypothetical protein FKN15_037756 [Acipenser sinensis]
MTCDDCLQLGPHCAWCSQENFTDSLSNSKRCDNLTNLLMKGCPEDLIEFPVTKVVIQKNESLGGGGGQKNNRNVTQIAPQKMTLKLRPANEVTFQVDVQQAEDYPVDVYYLMDLSASMVDDLETIKELGTTLSKEMAKLTSKFRLGFGSFVEKPVLPFIRKTPEELKNPCKDVDQFCLPTFGYKHVLPLTDSAERFNEIITDQQVSANIDIPECGFDAIMQAAVCGNFTDSLSNSKRCDNLTNLLMKGCPEDLIEFPVTKVVIQKNESLGGGGGQKNNRNVTQIAPQKITLKLRPANEVTFQVDVQQAEDYPVDVYYLMDLSASMVDDLETIKELGTTLSKEMAKLTSKFRLGFGSFVEKPVLPFIRKTPEELKNPCKGVDQFCLPTFGYKHVLPLTDSAERFNEIITDQQVSANIDIPECGFDAIMQAAVCGNYAKLIPGATVGILQSDSRNILQLIMTAYKELRSEIELEVEGDTEDIQISFTAICHDGTVLPGQKKCSHLQVGDTVSFNVTVGLTDCLRKPKHFTIKPVGFQDVLKVEIEAMCSCVCHHEAELNSSRCSAGKGTFQCGMCVCNPGHMGPHCECTEENIQTSPCKENLAGESCNGQGECYCGQCVCHPSSFGRIYGAYCECDDFSCVRYRGLLCGVSDTCQVLSCVECHLYAKEQSPEECYEKCKAIHTTVIDTEDCPKPPNIPLIIWGVSMSVLTIGIILLIIWKLFVSVHDRKEVAKFEAERANAKWQTGTNPLFRSSTTTFKNVTYRNTGKQKVDISSEHY